MPEGVGEIKQTPDIIVDPAARCESTLIANLLELYIHDLSAVFPGVRLGANGRFGYPTLDLYWSEPDRRFPFVIRRGADVVGFALITRGSPAADAPDVFDVAEFFIVRQHRRAGVGMRAAFLLWNRFPGRWIVRVSEGNARALPFWSGAIAAFTNGAAAESRRPGNPHPWRVFAFESQARFS